MAGWEENLDVSSTSVETHLAAMAAIERRRKTLAVRDSIFASRSTRSMNGNWHPKWVINTSRRCRMMSVLGAPSGAISSCATSPGPATVNAGEPFAQLSCGVCTRTLSVYRLRPGAMAVFYLSAPS